MVLTGESWVWSDGGMVLAGESWVWSNGVMVLTGESWRTGRKTCPSTTLSTHISHGLIWEWIWPPWREIGNKPGEPRHRPATETTHQLTYRRQNTYQNPAVSSSVTAVIAPHLTNTSGTGPMQSSKYKSNIKLWHQCLKTECPPSLYEQRKLKTNLLGTEPCTTPWHPSRWGFLSSGMLLRIAGREFLDVSKVTQCVHFVVSSGPLEYTASKRLVTPNDTASHPRRPELSAVPLWAPLISHSLQLTKMCNVNEWNYGEIQVQSRLGKGSTVQQINTKAFPSNPIQF